MMKYRGYVGRAEFDDEAGTFHGQVVGTRDVITFQGTTVAELRRAFKDSINDYLAFCAERGEQPEKPFSGQFVVRIPAGLHREINNAAAASGKSLNAWVGEQLQSAVRSSARNPRRRPRAAGKPKPTGARSRRTS
jgi:predicted HicB family RNase H-like nuclease